MAVGISASQAANLFLRSKLPIILQNEAAECGLACLVMVAQYFGHHASLAEMRRRFSVSLKGATLKSLMDSADLLGLSGRPVRLELEELDQLRCPAILHWDLKHFVVLAKVRRNKFWIHDPSRGARVLTRDEVARSFTGVALEFTATADFKAKKQAETLRLSDLFGQVRGLVAPIAQLLVLALALQAFGIIAPIINQTVIDDAISKGDLDLLTTLGLGFAVLMLISTSVSLLRGYIGLYLSTQLSFEMQANLLRHTLRLPAAWFERRHIGDILSRFGSLGPVQGVLTGTVEAVVLSSIMLAASLTMMSLYAPALTAIEVGAFVLFFCIRAASFPYVRKKTEEGLYLGARVQTTVLETLRGSRTFKLFGREQERLAQWQNEQAKAVNNSVQLARFGLWGGAGGGLLAGVQQLVVWFLGARMVIHGDLSLGMLFAFQAYSGQFGSAANSLIGQFFSFKTLHIHLSRLADIVHADAEQGIDVPCDVTKPLAGAIALRDLSFRYAEQEPWIIRAASLDIRPGEFVCLTGPSGQGKTTLFKLMLGLIDPCEGEVRYDGVALRAFGIRTLRERTGVVMQDDQLFAGTIADNIAFFAPDADPEQIRASAVAAQIDEEIQRLPMGYNTLISDLGSSLSGGQRQRVMIARALYRRPSILFLDEGTSNLDPENEARIMAVIRSLPMTRVVVTHREAAAMGADLVVHIEDRSVTSLELIPANQAMA